MEHTFIAKPNEWYEKVNEAYINGCRRFDGAIMGFGGCPMAKDNLTGNVPTEKLLSFFNSIKENTSINSLHFESCYNDALIIALENTLDLLFLFRLIKNKLGFCNI